MQNQKDQNKDKQNDQNKIQQKVQQNDILKDNRKDIDPKISQFLKNVTDEMTFSEARESAVKELLTHVEDRVETAMTCGVSKEEAIAVTLKKMGNPTELGASLNKIHQPKFDLILPLMAILLSAVGIWNLSGTPWMSLQTIWVGIGVVLIGLFYFLSARGFVNLTSALYGLGILGLAFSYFSGVVEDGQPYLIIAGLNIKIVDLSGVLFALGFPALGSRINLIHKFSNHSLSIWKILLFLLPMAYYSVNGFIWPGLLFFISGLCYLGMSGVSILNFISTGVFGFAMFSTYFIEAIRASNYLNRRLVNNAHTDYALRSMREFVLAELISATLMVILVLYGIKKSFSIRDFNLRVLALVGMSLMSVQIFTSMLVNLDIIPMVSAGINVPFISYGGSGIIANFLIIGILVSCLKRKSLTNVL